MGLWNGDDVEVFTINGQSRTYFGAHTSLGMEPIRSAAGLEVQYHQLSLANVAIEVELAIRGYDTRLAPIEVHRALFDLKTRQLVAPPVRILKGTINEISIDTGALGGQGRATVSIASAARSLTKALSSYRSDKAQRRVYPADRFREYADVSGEISVWWGEKRQV